MLTLSKRLPQANAYPKETLTPRKRLPQVNAYPKQTLTLSICLYFQSITDILVLNPSTYRPISPKFLKKCGMVSMPL